VLTKFVVGVAQIVDALGDPSVPGATILYGLDQISDGLGLAGEGGTAGADGAVTVGRVLASTVAHADIVTALHQAGVARAEQFVGLRDHGGDAQRSLFVFRQGGVS
jgi:hypothetical protein